MSEPMTDKKVKEPGYVEDLDSRLCEVTKHAERVRDNAAALEDRLFGDRPREAPEQSSQNGAFPAMNAKCVEIEQCLCTIDDVLAKI